MSTLHQDLEGKHCIDSSGEGRQRLISAVNELNARLRNYGRRAKIVVPLIILSLAFINFRLQHHLYSYRATNNLYDTWWAGLHPFHFGGLVWIIVGALGVYMVYVEAMVGITYVRFLSRSSDNYRFRANRFNPDGFYGWSRLREAITYQEAGAACAAISAFALFFIIQPAIGAVPTAVVLGFFILVVLYVFSSAIRSLRRQVSDDRKKQIKEILEKLPTGGESDGMAGQVATLVAYRHLQAIEKIPPMPIRQRSLVTGVAPIIAALIGLVSQLIKYLMMH
jgi:uncharacterized protein (DUF2062 family)